MRDSRYPIVLGLNLVAAAHCVVTQMTLSIALSFVAGHSVTVFAIFVGLYLAAMGAGVRAVERVTPDADWPLCLLALLTTAAFAASPGIPALLLVHERGAVIAVWLLGVLVSVALGAIAGAFLPAISKIAEAEGWPTARPLIAGLTSDYAGAFLGTALFALVLYPHLGLVGAAALSQAAAVVAINFGAIGLGVARRRPRVALAALLALDTWVAASCSFGDAFVGFLDQLPT